MLPYGIICDGRRVVFQVPQDRLDKLSAIILDLVDARCVSAPTLEKKWEVHGYASDSATSFVMDTLNSRSVETFPQSSRVTKHPHITVTPHSDLWDKLCRWDMLSSTTQYSPWCKAQHYLASIGASIGGGASDASAHGWGGGVQDHYTTFRSGGIFRLDV